jgi:hypothetical protein
MGKRRWPRRGLLALLLRAVNAKNHLDHLEISASVETRPRFLQ